MAFRDPRVEHNIQLSGLHRRAEEVFADLTAYRRQPIERIAEEYWRYCDGEGMAAQHRVAEAVREETVNEFYATTPHYLYELSYWEASLDKQAWFQVLARACRKYRRSRVLDFGGGVGGVSLCLSRQRIRCEHMDVPGKTFDYAAWRFQRHGLAVPMHHAVNGWPSPGSYDAIIAWDVLEHIFDLEGTIPRLAALLRPGGWLIEKSTFAPHEGHHEDIHLEQHACYNDIRQLEQLMARSGLRFRGQLKPSRCSRLLRRCGWPHAVAGIALVPRLKHGGNFLVFERTAA